MLDLVDRRALVNIELKGPHTGAPVKTMVADYIHRRGWKPEDFLISSFSRMELRHFSGGAVQIGLLFARSARLFRRPARALGAWSIHVPLAHVSPQLVARAHAASLKVFVFTVNNRQEMDRLAQMGADAVFTDYPDRWTRG